LDLSNFAHFSLQIGKSHLLLLVNALTNLNYQSAIFFTALINLC